VFLARNGFLRVAPFALLLGGILRVLGDDRVTLPFARSAVLVHHLTPGVTTVLIAWAAQDMWRGCPVATVREPWILAGARTVVAASLCLGAAGIAVLGQQQTVLIWLCVCFTGPAVLLAQHLPLWWVAPLLAQLALLRVGPDLSASTVVREVADPYPAVAILTVCLALAAGFGQLGRNGARPRGRTPEGRSQIA